MHLSISFFTHGAVQGFEGQNWIRSLSKTTLCPRVIRGISVRDLYLPIKNFLLSELLLSKSQAIVPTRSIKTQAGNRRTFADPLSS